MDKNIEKEFKYSLLLSAIYFGIFGVVSILEGSLPIMNIIVTIVCLTGFTFAINKNKNAIAIGYIAGFLMIISIIFSAIIEFLFGIIVLYATYRYNKELKK